jgi:hypothetical protein
MRRTWLGWEDAEGVGVAAVRVVRWVDESKR